MKRAAPFVKTPFLRWLVRIILCLLAFSILLVLLLKWVPVRYTPLMLKRSIEYRADTTLLEIQSLLAKLATSGRQMAEVYGHLA